MTAQKATEPASDGAYAAAVRYLLSGSPIGAEAREALAALLRTVDQAIAAGPVPTTVTATHWRALRLLGGLTEHPATGSDERAEVAERLAENLRRQRDNYMRSADHYHERLSRIDCGHGYRLTDSCPCCDVSASIPDMGARLVCAENHAEYGLCQQTAGHTTAHENAQFVWGEAQ